MVSRGSSLSSPQPFISPQPATRTVRGPRLCQGVVQPAPLRLSVPPGLAIFSTPTMPGMFKFRHRRIFDFVSMSSTRPPPRRETWFFRQNRVSLFERNFTVPSLLMLCGAFQFSGTDSRNSTRDSIDSRRVRCGCALGGDRSSDTGTVCPHTTSMIGSRSPGSSPSRTIRCDDRTAPVYFVPFFQ
jgi:hypothetical protein